MAAFTFKGREVTISIVEFGDLIEAQEAAELSGKTHDAMWRMLVKAATYADDGTVVFASVADIMKAPAPEATNIMAMSAEVSRLNLQPARVVANGHDAEPALPSL